MPIFGWLALGLLLVSPLPAVGQQNGSKKQTAEEKAQAAARAAEAEKQAAAELHTASMAEFQAKVAPLLAKHCQECHSAKKAEGDLDLATLNPDMKASPSAGRWALLLEQVTTREMPPQEKPRLSEGELAALVDWVGAEMKRSGKHLARRAASVNGNKVPHEILFSKQTAAAFDAAPRLRRLSPEIYSEFRTELAKDAPGIGQPFSPAGASTFKDMGDAKVDEPVTQQLLGNALLIVERLTAHKLENGEVKAVGFSPKEFLPLFDEKKPPTDQQFAAALKVMFDRALRRAPTPDEMVRYTQLYHKNVAEAGREAGVKYTLAAVLLSPEAIFRWELGAGEADEQGRVRLAPREIAFALAYALTDKRPENWLLAEAEAGKLDTADGVAAALRKMLLDPKLNKPRILRFFHEYFRYHEAAEVFKEQKTYPDHDGQALVADTDRLVLDILAQDREVLKELLTTNKSYVAYKQSAEMKKRRADELAKYEAEKAKNPAKFKDKKPPSFGRSIYEAYNLADFPDQQPVELPRHERAGILTQPAWLVAFSKSDENHAIFRGKFIRERLLGNVVPDVPITVDAQLPVAPEQTLRERMQVTQQEYCWQCHIFMNDLGLSFETYDHLGRFRTQELEKPVNSGGAVLHSGYAGHEGEVKHAVEMLHRLAASERVEQVFVRHAFRYWLGRNETPGDAGTLQAAQARYRASSGSMNELIVALLSSDSFLYRVPAANKQQANKQEAAPGAEAPR